MEENDSQEPSRVPEEVLASLSSESLTQLLQLREGAFDVKFEKIFGLTHKQFNTEKLQFAMATFSNLIGGMGYTLYQVLHSVK